MNVNDIFPSNYLKASDLKGAQVRVTIANVQMEMLGQGHDAQQRPVIYFEGKQKGLVANKTNMNVIAMVYGDETDDWTGAEIILFETMVDYQGKTTPAIRCKVPPRKPAQAVASRPVGATAKREPPPPIMDDEIPF